MAARTATAAKKTAAMPAAKKTVVRKRPSKVKSPTNVLENAYVPDIEVSQRYVGRKVYGVWDITIAEIASSQDKNILLMGDTGSGKTLFGEAVASHERRIYYSLPCDVSIDPSSLFGRQQPTEERGVFKWQDGPVTQVVRGPCGKGGECKDPKCKGGVFNISEINFMTPKIAASLYPLLDGRRYLPLLGHEGEVVRVHHDTLFIADMNPNYRGTMELNDAFKNRFDFKIEWGYDDEVEKKLVKSPTLRELAKKLRAMHGVELVTPVSTNMLMEFETFSSDARLGLDFAIFNFLGAFKAQEKDPVSKVIDLNKSKLTSDIAYIIKNAVDDDDDDDLEEVEWDEEDEG